MTKALLVAKWEFLTTVKRPGYIITVLAIPVFYGTMFGLAALAGRSATVSAGRIPTAVVDQAHILDIAFAGELADARGRSNGAEAVASAIGQSAEGSAAGSAAAVTAAMAPASALEPFESVDAAVAALKSEQVAAVFVIPADYLTSGRITAYGRDAGLFSQQGDQRRQTQVADAIRASLMHRSMPSEALARAYAPAASVTHMHLTPQGTFEEAADLSALGPLVGSFGVVLLLSISIFVSASFLQQATVADRQNRMIEILLSSLDSDELLAGKIIGLGGAGLLQVAIYIGLVIAPGAVFLSIFKIPLWHLVLCLAYYLVGFLLFASLMAGTGMLGRTSQEAAQISALWTLSSMSPFFFIANIGTAPNGAVSRALSFFPLTSPVTMMLRLGGPVPAVDVVLSLAIEIAAVLVALRGASRIFRAASLMQGKRATLPEFLRWLKAA